MNKLFGFILIVLCSCQNEQQNGSKISSSDTIRVFENNFQKDTTLLDEIFIDSLNIGRKFLNKIVVSKFRTNDSVYVDIMFYSKQNLKWVLRNDFHFLKDGVLGLETGLTDFNNDKLNDITFISNIAARGANEVRRLFIYDNINDKLIVMKNSENYPNMRYNKDLNCIDAFLVYGGCSTVFLKVSGDSLREFASVALHDGLTVTTYDVNGKEKIILEDTTIKASYIRYKNFKPLKEYEEEY